MPREHDVVTATRIDPKTGNLLVEGRRVFPLGLSDPPPFDSTAPNGKPAWAEIGSAGVNFARNYTVWTSAGAAEQIISLGRQLDAASQHGLQLWVALAGIDNDLSRKKLLDSVVNTLKQHPGLGVWKGADEPAHGHVPASGLIAVRKHLRILDPEHPIAIIQAPRAPSPPGSKKDKRLTSRRSNRTLPPAISTASTSTRKPPGAHAGGPPVNTDLSVVGDVTGILARATGRKAIWTTLQIAWSGVLPPRHRLVFPTLPEARFMAYDAIIAGARGLFFFGGHLKPAMKPPDQKRGWNWSYWTRVQRPLLKELSDAAHSAALTAPVASQTVKANAADIALSARQADGFFYLIAVRRSPSAHGTVRFTGLPPASRTAPCSHIQVETRPGPSPPHAAPSPTRARSLRTTHASTAFHSPARPGRATPVCCGKVGRVLSL